MPKFDAATTPQAYQIRPDQSLVNQSTTRLLMTGTTLLNKQPSRDERPVLVTAPYVQHS